MFDGKLGVGIKMLYDRDTLRGHRGEAGDIFAIGPSLQFRLTDHLHVDLSCMFGTNSVSDRQIGFLVIGYDFGPKSTDGKRYTPISTRGN